MGDFLKAVLKDVQFWVGPQALSPDESCQCVPCSQTTIGIESDSGFRTHFSIDSRTIKVGEIFCAIPGETVDGHRFLVEALVAGAAGLIVEKNALAVLSALPANLIHGKLVIVVDNTVEALIKLARSWRNQFSCPIVGITGSIGKTTTKEMLRSILAQTGFPAAVSHGNFNTKLGVSLSLLNMDSLDRYGVFEVGINEKGEMAEIVDILRPTFGVITAIAHSHTLLLGALSGVAEEKRILFSKMEPSDICVVNGDQAVLNDAYYHSGVIRFGLKGGNQVQAKKIKRIIDDSGEHITVFNLKIYGREREVVLPSWHEGLVVNALAAAAVANGFGISDQDVAKGLCAFTGVPDRFQKYTLPAYKSFLISDCYNANPESVRAALIAVSSMSATKKIAVLGDMLELGEREVYWHRQIGRILRRITGIDQVILVGERAKAIADTAPRGIGISLAETWEGVAPLLKSNIVDGTLVLVKGSNGVNLKNAVNSLLSS